MSRECTEYDVRISTYRSYRNGNIAHITFFNDSELLLDCWRVSLFKDVDNDRLYFVNGEHRQDGIKFSGRDKSILQLCSGYRLVQDMGGVYDLKFDSVKGLYYIDGVEKLADYEHEETRLGKKQLNHKSGVREKREDVIVSVALKDSAKKIVDAKNVSKQEDARAVVVDALLALLKAQVADNKDALSTIDTLEKYI